MDSQFIYPFQIGVGLVIGSAIAWFLHREKMSAAKEQVRAELATELATANERTRALEVARAELILALESLKSESAACRNALDAARDERAQLTERASRVPSLETQIAGILVQQQSAQNEILRLATVEAEKAQSLQSTTARLAEVEQVLTDTHAQFVLASTLLQQSNERRATLEAEAVRIPILEKKVADAELAVQEAHQRIASLRENASKTSAELQSERDVVITLRDDWQTEKGLREKTEILVSRLTGELQQSNERRATLEAEAVRIPILEKKLADVELAMQEGHQRVADLRENAGKMNAELQSEREILAALRNDWQTEKGLREKAEVMIGRLTSEQVELTTRLEAERSQSQEKLALLQAAKEELSNQFKTLANDILEDKTKRFTEQNQTNISQILDPLKERLTEFKAKVEEIHGKDTEQQASLRAELAQLKDLNRQITEEAHGLATALKGQAKKQGNWGELVLGNVLDRSGLREGKDFKREVSFSTEEGRKRPDVVVYLPQSKHLVIDAKVSLNAYTRYVNAEDNLERQQALREHVDAVASRIQELSNRTYFDLPGLNTPEMVFMFIPIESAFVEALRADESLFQTAIEQSVLVATPTTLLTSLNIVRQLWRFEEQNAHTAELADRASKVYKKLVSFLVSMEAVGKQLDKAKESFGTAMGQLVAGKGNLISQAKEFERLGVSVQAVLPEQLVAKAALELEHLPAPTEGTEKALR